MSVIVPIRARTGSRGIAFAGACIAGFVWTISMELAHSTFCPRDDEWIPLLTPFVIGMLIKVRCRISAELAFLTVITNFATTQFAIQAGKRSLGFH